MGLKLAIKRSYRHFLPRSLLEPRKWVRRHFANLFFYTVGLCTGMFVYARPEESERIREIFMIAMLVFIVLRFWSGATPQDFTREP